MDADHEFEIGGLHLREGLVAQDAGVVDEDVDAAPSLFGAGNHLDHLIIFGDVAAVRHRLAASRADFLDHGERRVGMARAVTGAAEIVDDDLGATLGEFEGVMATEAAAGSGDDGNAIIEADRTGHGKGAPSTMG